MPESESLSCLLDDFEYNLERVVYNMRAVSALELGLDPRAGYRLWVDEDNIVVRTSDEGRLRYYGGFEYVDDIYRIVVGETAIYRRDSGRVDECLDNLKEQKEE